MSTIKSKYLVDSDLTSLDSCRGVGVRRSSVSPRRGSVVDSAVMAPANCRGTRPVATFSADESSPATSASATPTSSASATPTSSPCATPTSSPCAAPTSSPCATPASYASITLTSYAPATPASSASNTPASATRIPGHSMSFNAATTMPADVFNANAPTSPTRCASEKRAARPKLERGRTVTFKLDGDLENSPAEPRQPVETGVSRGTTVSSLFSHTDSSPSHRSQTDVSTTTPGLLCSSSKLCSIAESVSGISSGHCDPIARAASPEDLPSLSPLLSCFKAIAAQCRCLGKGMSEDSSGEKLGPNLRPLILTFSDSDAESRYKANFYSRSAVNAIERTLIIFLLTFLAQSFALITVPRYYGNNVVLIKQNLMWTVRSAFCAAGFGLWFLLHYRDRAEISSMFGIRWLIFLLNLTFITAACTSMLSNSWAYEYEGEDVKPQWLYRDTLELFFYVAVLHHNAGLLFQYVVVVNMLLLAVALTFIAMVVEKSPVSQESVMVIIFFIALNAASAYFKERIDRLTFVADGQMKTTADRGKAMLADMLPRQVQDDMQNDRLQLSYDHKKMTFLFADICGFTSWAKSVESPKKVLLLLQKLFEKFDDDCTRLGLYKLCTIGDAYVAVTDKAVSGMPEFDEKTAIDNVLKMGTAMIANIELVRESLNIPQLKMRIGLHYGKCVGGVIGSGVLRYDLWGTDVFTGNQIESNGIPGHICVSGALKTVLAEKFHGRKFNFKYHKTIKVINVDHEVYQLLEETSTPKMGGAGDPSPRPGSSNASSSFFNRKVSPLHASKTLQRGSNIGRVEHRRRDTSNIEEGSKQSGLSAGSNSMMW